jgi:glycerol-3-phosphate dehydrogenase (NAD(P)+)
LSINIRTMDWQNKKVAVIGGGSWATAIVKILLNNLDKVNWYLRDKEQIEYLQKYCHNPRYLSTVSFNLNKLNLSNDLEQVFNESDIIFIVTPSAFLYEMFNDLKVENSKEKILVSAVKGMIPEEHDIPSRYFHKVFGTPTVNIALVSGPCHAEEVAMEKLSYLTIDSVNQENAEAIAEMMQCRYIKTSTSEDLFGSEIAVILKNIYAIAAGIYHGLGYGDNFQAVLISNALREMKRFLDVVNPVHRDVMESAYLGDLLVTAYSQFSRNRTFGTMMGKGYSVKSAQMEMDMIAEGYYALKSVHVRNKEYNIDLPIIDAVYNVVYNRISPVVEMRILADKLD